MRWRGNAGRSCRKWRWRVLRGDRITSVLIGASKNAQIEDAVGMLANRHFSEEELVQIEQILL